MPQTNIPLQFVAGQFWNWTDEKPDDLSGSWTWAAKFVFVGPDQFEISGTLSGTTYTFEKRPTETTKIKAGHYTFHRVWNNQQTSPNDQSVVDISGRIEILENPLLKQGGLTGVSWARETLQRVEAAIQSYSTTPVTQITIAGRTIIRPSLEQLMRERGILLMEIQREERAEKIKRGIDVGGKILFRFQEPS